MCREVDPPISLFSSNLMALRLIEQNDLIVLVKAAVGVVLRKDMSLNRRLYAWLLGTQEGKKKIFDGPAKSALIIGLQVTIIVRTCTCVYMLLVQSTSTRPFMPFSSCTFFELRAYYCQKARSYMRARSHIVSLFRCWTSGTLDTQSSRQFFWMP